MEILQTVCIALIQGITEFLPISSSAHIQLPNLLLDWEDRGLQFDIAIHAGSLLAVVVYFKDELNSLCSGTLRSWRTRELNDHADFTLKLIVATIPVFVAGFLLREIVASSMRDLGVIVIATVVFGLFLGLAEWQSRRLHLSGYVPSLKNPTYPVVLLIGFSQILALIPGASRSGVTMTAALLLGMSRTQAAKFSFLLAIPVISGAFALSLYDLSHQDVTFDILHFSIGFLVAAASAYLCISFFLRILEKIGLYPFVIYRLAVGIWLGLLLWL